MKANVIDKRHMSERKPIFGVYKNGVFKYYTGGNSFLSGIPVIGKFFEGDEHTVEVNGNYAIRNIKNEEEITLFWDGKKYTQAIYDNGNDKSKTDYSDLIRDMKIGNYIKNSMIVEPKNTMQELFNIALAVLILITIGLNIWSGLQFKSNNAGIYATLSAVNRTLIVTQKTQASMINITQSLVSKSSGLRSINGS